MICGNDLEIIGLNELFCCTAAGEVDEEGRGTGRREGEEALVYFQSSNGDEAMFLKTQ